MMFDPRRPAPGTQDVLEAIAAQESATARIRPLKATKSVHELLEETALFSGLDPREIWAWTLAEFCAAIEYARASQMAPFPEKGR